MSLNTPILGAVIAGGAARRFGADKGAALLNGVALIDHVAHTLRPQVDALVIIGRKWPDVAHLEDYPAPALGPLGGLNAALRHAAAHGYQTVLTAGCDTLPLPPNLVDVLCDAPAVIAGAYLFGHWPAALGDALHRHLMSQPDKSMRCWIEQAGAKSVPAPQAFVNINSPQDLADYARVLRTAD